MEDVLKSRWRTRRHATDGAPHGPARRSSAPGIQLIAVFNQRFTELGGHKQLLRVLAAFLLIALAGYLAAPEAAYHQQAEQAASRAAFNLASDGDVVSRSLTLGLSWPSHRVADPAP